MPFEVKQPEDWRFCGRCGVVVRPAGGRCPLCRADLRRQPRIAVSRKEVGGDGR